MDISDERVDFATVKQMMKKIQQHERGVYMSKRDISDAYRNVLVNPSDWSLLCIYNPEGQKMISNRLPMGGVYIPFIFDTLSALTVFAVKNNVPKIPRQFPLTPRPSNATHNADLDDLFEEFPPPECTDPLDMLNILDDFLEIHTFCNSKDEDGERRAKAQADAADQIFRALGWPLKDEKSVTAVLDLIFLGVGWNSEAQACYIPDEKANKYLDQIKEFFEEKRGLLTLKEIRSICGILVWVSFLAPQTRSRLYYLFQCLKAALRRFRESNSTSPSSIVVRLSAEAQHDLRWWQTILEDPPLYRPMLQNDVELEAWLVTTDAAPNYGVGGFWQNQYFSFELSPLGKSQHSTWAELFALVVASYIWGKQWTGQTIRWRTDCEAHVRGLFKIRTSAPKLLGLHDCLDTVHIPIILCFPPSILQERIIC